jgi:hypothetical protein
MLCMFLGVFVGSEIEDLFLFNVNVLTRVLCGDFRHTSYPSQKSAAGRIQETSNKNRRKSCL